MSISSLYVLLLAEVLSRYHQMIVSGLLLRTFQKHFKFIMAPFRRMGGGGGCKTGQVDVMINGLFHVNTNHICRFCSIRTPPKMQQLPNMI